MFGVSEVAVHPDDDVLGLAGQPVMVPGDWPRAYAVGVNGLVHDNAADVAVTDPVDIDGVVRVAALARAYEPVDVAVQKACAGPATTRRKTAAAVRIRPVSRLEPGRGARCRGEVMAAPPR